MANTKSMDDINPASAYQHSFGNLPNGSVISPGGRSEWNAEQKDWSGSMRPELKSAFSRGYEVKALAATSGGAGTAGYAMVPIYVDPMIVDRTRKYTPLVELIPRVSNMGITADYNVITAKGGGYTAAEDAALPETNTTYARASTAIKYLYSVGRVTGQAMAAVPSYIMSGFQPAGGSIGAFTSVSAPNAMQNEVLVKTREIRELEENLIVNGSVSTDATQYSGVIALMSTTNTVAKGTTALTLDDIDTAVRYAFDDGGRPNLAFCDSSTYTDLLGLLTAKIGYMQPTQQVFWGFTTIVLHTMVGDIPVIPSMYVSITTGSKAMYFLDLSVIEMRVLQDLTYEEMAHTNDSRKFLLKIYEALIIRATSFCSSITAIA
jgi:hypothetical protein